MKITNLSRFTAASLMLFTSVASSAPMYIDVGAVGSMGDSVLGVPTTSPLYNLLKLDSDTLTGAFDSMTFGISSSEDLTTISSGTIDTLRLDGAALSGFGVSEGIGEGIGINLYALWDNSTSTLGNISLWFEDDLDANGSADVEVASGMITQLSETKLAADITSLLSGFWLNSNMSNLLASELEPFKITMSVQSDGNSVDVKAVPEPSVFALMGLGLIAFGVVGRRTRKNSGHLA